MQSRGCGEPGDYLDLPYPAISGNITSTVEEQIGSEFLRLRYGVWAGLDHPLVVTSQQYARCKGQSAREVVMKHPDFRGRRTVNFTEPNLKFTRLTTPKYVIVLENSVIMNTKGQWDFIRTACRNFILHGLPASAHLGIVLYNDAAHIAHPIVKLGDKEKSKSRQSLSLQIKSKHNLSPSTGSCVNCGVHKAIEALGGSGSSLGGVIIVIGRGQRSTTHQSKQEDRTLVNLSVKHQLQLFSMSVLPPDIEKVDSNIERLAFRTGGESFLITDWRNTPKPSLYFYVNIINAFQTIERKTLPEPSVLVSFTSKKFDGNLRYDFHFSCMSLYMKAFKMEIMIKTGNLLLTNMLEKTRVSRSILPTWSKVTSNQSQSKAKMETPSTQ